VYQNDVEISTIYTSEVASYTKSKMTGYVTALMVKYDVFEGEKDQYFVVDQIVYAIRHPSDPYNKTDIYVTNGTDTLVNKVTIMASLETLLADANQVSFNGATWGQIGGNIGDQLDLQNQFSTKVNKTTTLTINSVTYDLSANRSWTISGAVWGSITGTLSAQTDLQSALDTKVPTARKLTINAVTYDLSANRSWTIGTGISIGDAIGGATSGSILYVNALGELAQSPTRLSYSDTDGLTINPSGTIVGGFTAGLNIKGADPTFRMTAGSNGYGYLLSGQITYIGYTTNNWSTFTTVGTVRENRFGFGGTHTIDSIVHVKAGTATDTVIIAQGIAGQINDLQQWNVGGTVGTRIDANSNFIIANNKYLKWRNVADSADINILYVDSSDTLQVVGTWQFPSGLVTDYIGNRSGAMTIGTTNAVSFNVQTNSSLQLSVNSNGLLQFQGTTSAFPAIKRNGTQIDIRLADDSGYAGLNAATLGLGTSSPTSFADIAASTTTRASLRLRSGTLPTVPNAGDISYDGAFKGWNGSTWTTFGGGLINFTESYSSSVGHSSKFAAIGVGTNINVVLNPKGTGGFIAQTPDSTATGGNARGSRIVDWQTSRGSADQVASGDSSVISGGSFNTASAINTVVGGGNRNIASGIASVVVGGINGRAYLYGQQAKASGSFTGITSDIGIAQASEVIVRRLTSAVNSGDNSQLYADAAQSELLIPFGSNRSWNVIVETVAVCTIVGSGSGTVGDTYTSVYQLGFKRVGGTSTIVGTATLISSNSGAGMAGALMVFSVGASNDLKVEFQAPSTATATTFRIVSNVRLVEIDFN